MDALAAHDVAVVRAPNPSPLTLDGTNTWLVGRDPAWIVDPGPDIAEHVDAVADAVERRGGAGGIALTHRHPDHSGAAAPLRRRLGVPVAMGAAAGEPDGREGARHLGDGDRFGPLTAIAAPGHAPDHLAYLAGRVLFTGDAVLGTGSVFIAPHSGALAAYLDVLRRLRALDVDVLCPGHGPVVTDPAAKLDEYLSHRLDRERRLLAALDAGARSEDELLNAAWSDVPAALRPAAALTLAAHLAKLADEGRLPPGVDLESGRRRWAAFEALEGRPGAG